MSGCNKPNLYAIYDLKEGGGKSGHKLFKAREKSTCFQRTCTCCGRAPLSLEIEHISKGTIMDGVIFLEVKKSCNCIIPMTGNSMEVFMIEGG